MQTFLAKVGQTGRIIFRLCTLDVEKAREDAANKLVEAIGEQYDVLGNPKAKKPEKQKAARLMQVLTSLLSDVAVGEIPAKWSRMVMTYDAITNNVTCVDFS